MTAIAEFFVRHTFQVSLLITAVFLVRFVLRKQLPSSWIHLLWVVVAVRLCLPVIPASPWSAFNVGLPNSNEMVTQEPQVNVTTDPQSGSEVDVARPKLAEPTEAAPSSVDPILTVAPEPMADESQGFPVPEIDLSLGSNPKVSEEPNEIVWESDRAPFPVWFALGFAVWGCGFLGFLGMAIRRYLLVRRMVLRSVRCTDASKQAQLEVARQRLGVRGDIGLYVSHEITVPAICQGKEARLLLPVKLLPTLDHDQLDHIVLHELAHLKRRDHLSTWIMEIGRCLHWFNPMVWLAAQVMRQDRELACDAYALKRLEGRRQNDYGQTLLDVTRFLSEHATSSQASPHLGMADSHTVLSQRIVAISRFRRPSLVRQVLAAGIVAVLSLGFATDRLRSADEVSAIDPNAKVGPLGSPRKLVFSGNQRFTDEAIRTTILKNTEYLRGSHPMAPLEAYIEIVERLVTDGYRKGGYRDATAAVVYQDAKKEILVRVSEGPRIVWGEVKLSGIDDNFAAKVIQALQIDTEEQEGAISYYQEEIESFGKLAEAENERFLEERGELPRQWRGANWQSPIWQRNEPVDFSTQAIERYEEAISSALGYLGYASPTFEIKVDADTEEPATLRVVVEDIGPAMVRPAIEVEGNVIHTDEEILSFLALPEVFTGADYGRIEQRLWDSGRFADFCIFGDESKAGEPTRVRLLVREMPGVPRLDEPLTKAQSALLKLGKWFTEYKAEEYSLKMKATQSGGRPLVELDMQSDRQLYLSLAIPVPGVPIQGRFWNLDGQFIAAWQGDGQDNSGRLVLPDVAKLFSLMAKLAPTDGADDKHISLSFGGGLNSANEGEPLISTIMAPSALLNTAVRFPMSAKDVGEEILLTSSAADLEATIDRETGRLVSLEAASDDGSTVLVTTIKDPDKSIEAPTWASNPDYKTALSWVNLLKRGDLLQRLTKSDSKWEDFNWAALNLIAEGCSPLIGLFGKQEDDVEEFPNWTSKDAQAPDITVSQLTGMVSSFILGASFEVLPERSWLWEVAREAHASTIGMREYRQPMLDQWAEPNGLGPVGCLVVAALLDREGADESVIGGFAKLAEARLDAGAFRRDWEALILEPSVLRECFLSTLEALATLPEEECAMLANGSEGLLEAIAEFQKAYPELVADETITVDEVSTLMDALWLHGLKEWTAKQLEARLAMSTTDGFERVLVTVNDWPITQAELVLLAERLERNPVQDREDLLKQLVERESALKAPPFEEQVITIYDDFLAEAEEAPESPWSKAQLARALTRQACHETLYDTTKKALGKPERLAGIKEGYQKRRADDEDVPAFEQVKDKFLEGILEDFLSKHYKKVVKAATIVWPE